MMRQMVVLVTVSLLLNGCAAMFHGTSQQISIRSNVPGTKIYVNEAFVGTDNTVTTFKKNQKYTVVGRKDGFYDAMVVATKSFDATTLLGILLDWGLISILIVDGAATGAWSQFDQTSFIIDPQPMARLEGEGNQNTDLYAELEKLGSLRQNKILTEEEFQTRKTILLEKYK